MIIPMLWTRKPKDQEVNVPRSQAYHQTGTDLLVREPWSKDEGASDSKWTLG